MNKINKDDSTGSRNTYYPKAIFKNLQETESLLHEIRNQGGSPDPKSLETISERLNTTIENMAILNQSRAYIHKPLLNRVKTLADNIIDLVSKKESTGQGILKQTSEKVFSAIKKETSPLSSYIPKIPPALKKLNQTVESLIETVSDSFVDLAKEVTPPQKKPAALNEMIRTKAKSLIEFKDIIEKEKYPRDKSPLETSSQNKMICALMEAGRFSDAEQIVNDNEEMPRKLSGIIHIALNEFILKEQSLHASTRLASTLKPSDLKTLLNKLQEFITENDKNTDPRVISHLTALTNLKEILTPILMQHLSKTFMELDVKKETAEKEILKLIKQAPDHESKMNLLIILAKSGALGIVEKFTEGLEENYFTKHNLESFLDDSKVDFGKDTVFLNRLKKIVKENSFKEETHQKTTEIMPTIYAAIPSPESFQLVKSALGKTSTSQENSKITISFFYEINKKIPNLFISQNTLEGLIKKLAEFANNSPIDFSSASGDELVKFMTITPLSSEQKPPLSEKMISIKEIRLCLSWNVVLQSMNSETTTSLEYIPFLLSLDFAGFLNTHAPEITRAAKIATETLSVTKNLCANFADAISNQIDTGIEEGLNFGFKILEYAQQIKGFLNKEAPDKIEALPKTALPQELDSAILKIDIANSDSIEAAVKIAEQTNPPKEETININTGLIIIKNWMKW